MRRLSLDSRNTQVLFLLITLAFTACNPSPVSTVRVTADADSTKYPRPHMWVCDSTSISNETNYQYLADILSSSMGKDETDSIYYSAAEFTGMIDYFKTISGIQYMDVYPAAFGASGSPSVPSAALSGKLTLLFVPVDKGYVGKGYFLLPEGAAAFDPKTCQIADLTAIQWINNFSTTKLPLLKPLLNPKDPANFPDGVMTNPGALSNTVHLWYYFSDIVELENEKIYQDTANHNRTDGFKVFFSSFPAKTGQNSYGNRLYVQYEFTRDIGGNHQVYYIDTTTDFGLRPTQKPHYRLNPKGFDNGQMCPPTCTP
jgi:hypothetical protein